MSSQSFWHQPFSVQWRKALVSAPRLVPLSVLKFTSGEGPHPFLLSLPSRTKARIPVYVFVPTEQLERKSPQTVPIILDFHGGGFVLGTCMEQAPFCAQLARDLKAVVVTVDYRMGPIDSFPAAIEDGEDILDAILRPGAPGYLELRTAIADRIHHDWEKIAKASASSSKAGDLLTSMPKIELDKNRLAIAGFSSGGNLALNLALTVTPPQIEHEWPSRLPPNPTNRIPLLLFYPSLDCRQLPSERPRPAKLTVSPKFLADLDDILMPTYLPRDKASHPRGSPGLAPIKHNTTYGGPGGLHPKASIFLVLPELDTLADQSEVWVRKVQEEGRGEDLVVERYEGMKHGWTQMPESWLDEPSKRTRMDTYVKSVAFTAKAWAT